MVSHIRETNQEKKKGTKKGELRRMKSQMPLGEPALIGGRGYPQ